MIFYSEIESHASLVRSETHSAMAPSTRVRRVRWAWIAGAGWLVAIVAVFSPRRMAGSERGMEREWVPAVIEAAIIEKGELNTWWTH